VLVVVGAGRGGRKRKITGWDSATGYSCHQVLLASSSLLWYGVGTIRLKHPS